MLMSSRCVAAVRLRHVGAEQNKEHPVAQDHIASQKRFHHDLLPVHMQMTGARPDFRRRSGVEQLYPDANSGFLIKSGRIDAVKLSEPPG
jgi:hypothetical protein